MENINYIESQKEEVQTTSLSRTISSNLSKMVGEKVLIKGWVSQYRELKKMSFLVLRDIGGYCQIFIPKGVLKSLTVESVVEVIGVVKEEAQSKYNGIEIIAEEIKIISEANILPFPINREEDAPPFNTLNIHRPLTLRKEKERCIFKIKAGIINAFREFLNKEGFTEIFSTKLSASGLEGGSNMFEVDFFDKKMYLTQSPQFYKQMMVGVYEKVYEVGNVYRAEGSNTNRHLSEFIGLDIEMGFIQSAIDIMKMEEKILKYIFNYLNLNHKYELNYFGVEIPIINEIPIITYNQLLELLKEKDVKLYNIMVNNGITSEIERWISNFYKNEYNTDFIFIYKYPLKDKPFYTMPIEEYTYNNELLSESFDLIYNGIEITSGGQRIHNYSQLLTEIKNKGLNVDNFESYLMPFKYGMPPHGGFGIGVERIVKQLLNLTVVDEASLIPRTAEKFIH